MNLFTQKKSSCTFKLYSTDSKPAEKQIDV